MLGALMTLVSVARFVTATTLVDATTFVYQRRLVTPTWLVTWTTWGVVTILVTVRMSWWGGRKPAASAGNPPGPVGKPTRPGLRRGVVVVVVVTWVGDGRSSWSTSSR